MTEQQFPPPAWWYEATAAISSNRFRRFEIPPLDYPVLEGVKHARYQLPENPVEPGSVLAGGYLFSNLAGELIDSKGVLAGGVDFATGIIVINLTVSPDPGTRLMQYALPA